jgi:hypothetical protein
VHVEAEAVRPPLGIRPGELVGERLEVRDVVRHRSRHLPAGAVLSFLASPEVLVVDIDDGSAKIETKPVA